MLECCVLDFSFLFLSSLDRQSLTLGQLYDRLKQVYCSNIGYEYMHIPSVERCNWLREKIELAASEPLTQQQRVKILRRLTYADHFEQFLAKKYTSAKRFGLEGAESVIAGMKAMIGRSAELGIDQVVMGMPHRGRLNVLNSVVKKPMELILSEFKGIAGDDASMGSGDVKYHLGYSHDRISGEAKKSVHVTLLANPSHLEAVNPVVVGKVRAKQHYSNDSDRSKVMGSVIVMSLFF